MITFAVQCRLLLYKLVVFYTYVFYRPSPLKYTFSINKQSLQHYFISNFLSTTLDNGYRSGYFIVIIFITVISGKMFIKQSVFLFIFTLLFISFLSKAEEPDRIYKYQSKTGVPSFSDIAPIGRPYELVKIGCYACNVKSHVDWHKARLYLTLFTDDINSAAKQHHIDPAFVRAVIHAESHFNPKAVSKQGAQGLMQLMPATAQWLGVNNPFIAQQNIKGGVKHLARLLKKYNGNARMASAAYNAGEGAVKKFGGIPPYAETKVYVERVEILRRRYQKAMSI